MEIAVKSISSKSRKISISGIPGIWQKNIEPYSHRFAATGEKESARKILPNRRAGASASKLPGKSVFQKALGRPDKGWTDGEENSQFPRRQYLHGNLSYMGI